MQMLTIHGAAVWEDAWGERQEACFQVRGRRRPPVTQAREPQRVTAQPRGWAPAERSRPEQGLGQGRHSLTSLEGAGRDACPLAPSVCPSTSSTRRTQRSGPEAPDFGHNLLDVLV